MEKKTLPILTIVSTLFCGLPGLCGLCFFSISLLGSFTPEVGIPNDELPYVIGAIVMMLGLSMLFIAIPMGLGAWNWWSNRPKELSMDEVLIPDDDF